MLLTENPEKIPDNEHCVAGGTDQPACAPGFFDAAPLRGAEPQQPHACCEGFYCPAELTCMIPCPIGAYCPRWDGCEEDGFEFDWCCCCSEEPSGRSQRAELFLCPHMLQGLACTAP